MSYCKRHNVVHDASELCNICFAESVRISRNPPDDHDANEIAALRAKLTEAETTLAACELARLREVNARLDEQNELRAKLSAAEARIGRLRRLALAHESPKRRGPSGGGTDYRLEEINRARVDCREHNDLTPPTADNNAAQPQKD